MIYNKDTDTRKLEEEAYKVDPKETEFLNGYYHGEFNNRTGDMNIYCYEYELKRIIEKAKENK